MAVAVHKVLLPLLLSPMQRWLEAKVAVAKGCRHR